MSGGMLLDIGGGGKPRPGYTCLDIRPLDTVDIVHDFEDYPWPLLDESVSHARAYHVVEHINPAQFGFILWMDEVWRILQPDGRLSIQTPYAGSPGYWQDPTHVNPCNEITFAYFDPGHATQLWRIYKPKPWQLVDISWDAKRDVNVLMRKRVPE